MKEYKEKEGDQEIINEIQDKIDDIHFSNPKKYNGNLMASACLSSFVFAYKQNGLSYKKFCTELDNIKIFFKNKWETQ